MMKEEKEKEEKREQSHENGVAVSDGNSYPSPFCWYTLQLLVTYAIF